MKRSKGNVPKQTGANGTRKKDFRISKPRTRKVARTKNTGNAGNGKHKVYQKEVLVLEPLSKLPEWHLIYSARRSEICNKPLRNQ
jgi:hypothetical protein